MDWSHKEVSYCRLKYALALAFLAMEMQFLGQQNTVTGRIMLSGSVIIIINQATLFTAEINEVESTSVEECYSFSIKVTSDLIQMNHQFM